jgi:hypothetical protein
VCAACAQPKGDAGVDEESRGVELVGGLAAEQRPQRIGRGGDTDPSGSCSSTGVRRLRSAQRCTTLSGAPLTTCTTRSMPRSLSSRWAVKRNNCRRVRCQLRYLTVGLRSKWTYSAHEGVESSESHRPPAVPTPTSFRSPCWSVSPPRPMRCGRCSAAAGGSAVSSGILQLGFDRSGLTPRMRALKAPTPGFQRPHARSKSTSIEAQL